jgi:signal transduction histidine kinase
VGLVAYRVIQEALTNALRYAPGARTEVAMSTTESDLVIEVTNDASPEMSTQISPHASPHTSPDADPVRTGPGVGSGLLGLAERLRVYRGTLQAGRRLGGGFLVRAQIPVDPT